MPVLSRFLGIVIAMYYRDHEPAHFHARYGDYEITVALDTGIVEGQFPRRALRHTLVWYDLHVEELREDWQLAQRDEPLRPIAPLESGMVHLVEARVISGYIVWLRFSDGVEGRLDLGQELHGRVFEPLKGPKEFNKLALDPELGTITWPNGADFAPEFLYAAVKRAAA